MMNTMNYANTRNHSNAANCAAIDYSKFNTHSTHVEDSNTACSYRAMENGQPIRPYVRGKVRHFLPILATVGWLVMWMLGHMSFFSVLGGILIAVGVISALTVCPGKLLFYPILCIVGGFKICRAFVPFYGIGDLIAGLVGLYLGTIVGCIISLGLPAILTIRKWNHRYDAA